MKTLVKSAVILFAASVFTIPASVAATYEANPVSAQDTVVKKDTTVKKDAPILLAADEVTYTKIETSAVPEAVTKAVAAKYDGYTVSEAYKGSDNSYKLSIRKADANLTVYFNEAGEFQKEESPALPSSSSQRV